MPAGEANTEHEQEFVLDQWRSRKRNGFDVRWDNDRHLCQTNTIGL